MKCLSCSTGELVPTKVGEISVDKCTECGGMWLERGELDQLRDDKDNDIRWIPLDLLHEAQEVTGKLTGRDCPNGHGPTVRLNYGDTGLELDVCRVCGGIWLDPGEFDKMLAAMEEKAIATHASGYVRESLREAREVLARGGLSSHEWKDLGAVLRMLRMRVGVEAPVIGNIIRSLPR